jgi:hypothetical protein
MTPSEVRNKLELLGLIVNNKAVSFTKFKSIADAHQYGSRGNKIYIVFYGHPKENMFAFYPPQTTKKESMDIAYQYYLTMVENADINEFTYGNVCWTDRGYPLNYRKVG